MYSALGFLAALHYSSFETWLTVWACFFPMRSSGQQGYVLFSVFFFVFLFFLSVVLGNRITLLKTPERRSYAIWECIVSLHKISELRGEIWN